jgi:hypothetical protein
MRWKFRKELGRRTDKIMSRISRKLGVIGLIIPNLGVSQPGSDGRQFKRISF